MLTCSDTPKWRITCFADGHVVHIAETALDVEKDAMVCMVKQWIGDGEIDRYEVTSLGPTLH